MSIGDASIGEVAIGSTPDAEGVVSVITPEAVVLPGAMVIVVEIDLIQPNAEVVVEA